MQYSVLGSKKRSQESKDPTPYLEIVAGLATGLSSYFFIRGMVAYKLSFDRVGAEAQEQLGNYESAADIYFGLASMQDRFHDNEGFDETTDKLITLAEKMAIPEIQALASMCLGDQAKSHHKFSEAINHYEQAVNFFRDSLQDRSTYNIGTLGIALGKLGRVYEITQQYQKALAICLEELDLFNEINDHINLGPVYHHLGNCYASLDNLSEALQSYQQAIEFFTEMGQSQYLGNSLTEIGELVIETNLSSDLEEFLSEELLKWGLNDVREEVEILLSRRYTDDFLRGWNRELLRKVFAVAKLVSLTTKSHILWIWAEQFGEEVIVPLLDATDLETVAYLEQQRLFVNYLQLILTLALTVGEIAENQQSVTDEHLNELCNYCYQFTEWGWDYFKPFQWLAAWLEEHKIANIPSYKLRWGTEMSLLTGEPVKFLEAK